MTITTTTNSNSTSATAFAGHFQGWWVQYHLSQNQCGSMAQRPCNFLSYYYSTKSCLLVIFFLLNFLFRETPSSYNNLYSDIWKDHHISSLFSQTSSPEVLPIALLSWAPWSTQGLVCQCPVSTWCSEWNKVFSCSQHHPGDIQLSYIFIGNLINFI